MMKQEHLVGFHVEKSWKISLFTNAVKWRSTVAANSLAGRVIFLICFAFSGFIRYSPAAGLHHFSLSAKSEVKRYGLL